MKAKKVGARLDQTNLLNVSQNGAGGIVPILGGNHCIVHGTPAQRPGPSAVTSFLLGQTLRWRRHMTKCFNLTTVSSKSIDAKLPLPSNLFKHRRKGEFFNI
jgi:hypothetical protein